MRTRATRTPSASRTSMASGCPPASDAMVAGAHPSVAVDGIVLQDGKLVAVRRKNEPYRGIPALPGGFVELGETTVEAGGPGGSPASRVRERGERGLRGFL